MMYIIKQSFKTDCGFTCLKVLLSNIFHCKDFLYLGDENYQNEYSFYDLTKIAEKYGLVINGYQSDSPIFNNLIAMSITLIKIDSSYHYVLIEKIKKSKIYLFDPLLGRLCLQEKFYNEHATNNFLIVESFSPKNQPKSNHLRIYGYNVVLVVNSSFQILCIFFASFFTGDVSLLFFMVVISFTITIIINQIVNYLFLRTYDKTIIYPLLEKIDRCEIENTQEIIENEYQLKKVFFTNKVSRFEAFIYITFLFFVLLLNDLTSLFVILTIILVAWIKNNYINIFNKKNNLTINVLEQCHDNFLINFKNADNFAYKHAININIFDTCAMILILLLNLLICIYNHNIFYFIYFVVFEKILYDKISSLKELNKSKDQYNTLLSRHNCYLEKINAKLSKQILGSQHIRNID